jgi:hypothetical protein
MLSRPFVQSTTKLPGRRWFARIFHTVATGTGAAPSETPALMVISTSAINISGQMTLFIDKNT